MRVLIVSRYKEKIAGHAVAFVEEQYESLRELVIGSRKFVNKDNQVELFLLRGNYWKQWKALRRKIREFKPDVIHAHYGLSCLAANLATRSVPIVSTYHGSDINLSKVRPFSKMAMRLSAWNIFVSKRNVELAQPKIHWSLVPCGVALSEEQLQTRDEARAALVESGRWKVEGGKKVLFAGAFDNAVKDPELAKEAIKELRAKSPELREELIELKGYTREEVNRLMCACNCLLMTSKTEGSPQVIKEAMACGCPIVSVDVGDVEERVANVDGCYVVNSREPKEIANALEKAFAFEGKTNGREKIIDEGLTNEMVAMRILGIYQKVIRKER